MIQLRMNTVRTEMEVMADGAVIPSFVPGDLGEIEIQCSQNSSMHQFLTAWLNDIIVAAEAADVTNATNTTLLMQDNVTSHICTGIGPQKFPDEPHSEKAQMVTWILLAANITNQ
jgi:hypothetical protein